MFPDIIKMTSCSLIAGNFVKANFSRFRSSEYFSSIFMVLVLPKRVVSQTNVTKKGNNDFLLKKI